MKKSDYPQLKTIIKAFNILDVITKKDDYRLSELARDLHCPPSSIHRILFTLKSLGYITQNQHTNNYSATLKIFELGERVIQKLNITQIAKNIMTELGEETSESVHLAILDGIDVICIANVESRHNLSMDQPVGSRCLAYNTANGKVILANLGKDQILKLFLNHTFSQTTQNSIKSLDDLEKNLEIIRTRGYAIDNEEYIIGVRCVGAPIFNNRANVVAGLSIAGPALRIKRSQISILAKKVMFAANSISRQLGYINR